MLKKILHKITLVAMLSLAIPVNGLAGELSPQAARKLDPKLRSLILSTNRFLPKSILNESAAGNWVRVFIKTNGPLDELRARGARLIAVVDDIATAIAPVDRLHHLASLDEVVYIELSQSLKLLNDVAVVQTRGREARQQYNLSGQGVIVGMLDSGIDWKHQDFRLANGATRIKYLLDLSDPGDTNNDGVLDGTGPFGGTLYSEGQINAGNVAEADRNGHGTHVTGSAAGNGSGTSAGLPAGTYAGMAPEADIIFVKSQTGDLGKIPDADVISALKFIDSLATLMRKPYVANLSLGGHAGPHDGTSLFEQAIDRMVGSGKPGKAIVIAAGNDGEKKIHAGGNMSGSAVTIDFNVPSYTVNSGSQNDFIYFDLWYSGTANLSFRLTGPDGTNYGPVAGGSRLDQNTSNGNIFIDNAQAGVNPNNGDKQVALRIFDFTSNRPPTAGKWTLTITGSSGRYDLWLYDSSMGAELTSNIDYSRLVTVPGTAKNVITVGAWISKKIWIDRDGNQLTISSPEVGDIGIFSSPGPARDSRVKPEISAPGQMIASTLSTNALPQGPFSIWKGTTQYPNAFILQDSLHAIGFRTSFSAALVSGGVALMLQKFPRADAIQIRQALIAGAKADNFTGTVPNDKWGHGKVDFVGAINNLITSVETDKNSGGPPQKFTLSQNYPNPFWSEATSPAFSGRNPVTTIRYTLPSQSQVVLAIYDLTGRQVALLEVALKPAGEHVARWDGRNAVGNRVTNGIYFYRLEAKSPTGNITIITKKMMVLQ